MYKKILFLKYEISIYIDIEIFLKKKKMNLINLERESC